MRKKLKICFYPRYDMNGGSSRCRAYYIQQKLLEWGHDAFLMSAPYTADVIVFQKTYENPYCEIARKAKEKGIKIVFDMDDDYRCKEMLELADVVVCDSQGLVDFCQNQTTKKLNGRVIRNPVDYIKEPLPRRIHKKKKVLDIVYFAHPVNLKAFANCAPALKRLKEEGFKFNLYYIAGQRKDEYFRGFNPKWIRWKLSTFSESLRKFDISVLPQAWNWKGPAKQTESVAHNVPAVCEKILPNEELYKLADLEKYLASTDEEWYRAIKKLFKTKERNHFLDKVLPVVWKYRSHEYITQQWLDLFYEVLKNG